MAPAKISGAPTITAFLRSGLGNQLFIYAAARAFADKTGANLRLDSAFFRTDRVYRRRYQLDRFNIRAESFAPDTGALRAYLRLLRSKLLREHVHLPWPSLRVERNPCRYQPFPETHRSFAIDGYWQSEKYFADDFENIFNDLSLCDESILTGIPSPYDEIQAAGNSVFLHMRSYADIPGKQDFSAALPVEYARNAIKHMRSHLAEFTLFVFSDDIAWASHVLEREKRNGLRMVFIEPQNHFAGDAAALRDFHLMTLCSHGICANSSFSWWANRLGEHRCAKAGKKSIRIHPAIKWSNEDFWPDRWVGLPIVGN